MPLSLHTVPSGFFLRAAASPLEKPKRSPYSDLISRPRHATQPGFTLLEILTAMALFFMVAGILVSGVSQAIRVAEVGATESIYSRDQAMRLAWFREAVGLTVLPPPGIKPSDKSPPLIGDVHSIAGLSMAVPNAKTRGPTAYRFEIGFSADTGEGQLALVDLTDRISAVSSTVLASWRGAEGRFFFLDEQGIWHDQWPSKQKPIVVRPAGAPLRSELPMAVELRYGVPAKSVVVAIQDRELPPPTLSEMMN